MKRCAIHGSDFRRLHLAWARRRRDGSAGGDCGGGGGARLHVGNQLGELRFGVEVCSDPTERAIRAAWLRQVESRPVLGVTKDTAAAFGVLAAAVRQAGRRPRYNDVWIAAQAIEHGYALLTINADDFSGLPGLRLLTL